MERLSREMTAETIRKSLAVENPFVLTAVLRKALAVAGQP